MHDEDPTSWPRDKSLTEKVATSDLTEESDRNFMSTKNTGALIESVDAIVADGKGFLPVDEGVHASNVRLTVAQTLQALPVRRAGRKAKLRAAEAGRLPEVRPQPAAVRGASDTRANAA
jgi:hypothetical protein